MSPNNFDAGEMPEFDIQIITSGGHRIPAHSTVLVRNLRNFNFTFSNGRIVRLLKENSQFSVRKCD